MKKIALITPSTARPKQFANLCKYIDKFTYTNFVHYVAGENWTDYNFSPSIVKVPTYPTNNLLSICNNYKNLLDTVKEDYICILEDDDWYSSNYLEPLVGGLEAGAAIVGYTPSYYYWPKGNNSFGSYNVRDFGFPHLACTALHRNLIPALREICLGGYPFLDGPLWAYCDMCDFRRLKLSQHTQERITHVGMKGCTNAGISNRDTSEGQPDTYGLVLKDWLREDAGNY